MGKIILNLAMSLDGYIAGEDGTYSWIKGDGSHALDTSPAYDFHAFLNRVDTVVMGRRCFEQNMHLDFPGHQVLVAGPEPDAGVPLPNVRFVSGDLCGEIRRLQKQSGQDIYLFGGGVLVHQFLMENQVDEFIIGIIPIVLGKGIPLFLGGTPPTALELVQYWLEEGIVVLRYKKRL